MMRKALRSALDGLGLTARAFDTCSRLQYALHREAQRRNALFASTGPHDGLPLPPPYLVYLVAGHFDVQEYYQSGVFHAGLLRRVLAANGFDAQRFGSLLDFGCGSGRVLRHWRDLPGTALHGTDYTSRLVAWCRGSLPFAEFRRNSLAPPLSYPDACFDFAYAISVFTHLPEELQHVWMRELERVLKLGGVLLLTTKGQSRLALLGEEERRRFARGELVVREARYAGKNLCASFHPERFVRDELAGDLEVLDFVPAVEGGDQTQDVFLFRRPGAAPVGVAAR